MFDLRSGEINDLTVLCVPKTIGLVQRVAGQLRCIFQCMTDHSIGPEESERGVNHWHLNVLSACPTIPRE